MSTRNRNLRADSSPRDLLAALYDAETKLLEIIAPNIASEDARTRYNHLKRIRRLVSHHLRQQGERANEDDQRNRPE